jgi:hypothetical protein
LTDGDTAGEGPDVYSVSFGRHPTTMIVVSEGVTLRYLCDVNISVIRVCSESGESHIGVSRGRGARILETRHKLLSTLKMMRFI